ncbi:sigma-70 family RNA polymerase sigma factor [Chryseosolibacter indicus]|uniref:Sigma-70 family RNA polymerase sigma factor n=1 Tax=Chryseosolibacter indicus TaxID=2782351 RepID=A0ABS5VSA8_9BACT|nr:sigma-70 family RNA polymerase sigma factor [Chryseosolibacter indicus]MBT1704322.1 sigma-70 family RNA polymerase sigma factor [Chryseosolibacter indicus]
MEDLRSSLILYAYNILGSYEESKDVVQDALLKMMQMNHEEVRDERLYLIRMVINKAIDQKRKQQRERSHYPGQWLPEPVATDDPETSVFRKEVLSYSLMVLLEKLDTKQRAVFILKEAFDYDHEEIAEVLGISVENSRKILSRARSELKTSSVPRNAKQQLTSIQRYMSALQNGDMKELEQLLATEITVVSDGGGKATAFINPIRGVKAVRSLLVGLYKKAFNKAFTELRWLNNQPALFYYHEGDLVAIQIFSLYEQQFENIFYIRNPDKMINLKKD